MSTSTSIVLDDETANIARQKLIELLSTLTELKSAIESEPDILELIRIQSKNLTDVAQDQSYGINFASHYLSLCSLAFSYADFNTSAKDAAQRETLKYKFGGVLVELGEDASDFLVQCIVNFTRYSQDVNFESRSKELMSCLDDENNKELKQIIKASINKAPAVKKISPKQAKEYIQKIENKHKKNKQKEGENTEQVSSADEEKIEDLSQYEQSFYSTVPPLVQLCSLDLKRESHDSVIKILKYFVNELGADVNVTENISVAKLEYDYSAARSSDDDDDEDEEEEEMNEEEEEEEQKADEKDEEKEEKNDENDDEERPARAAARQPRRRRRRYVSRQVFKGFETKTLSPLNAAIANNDEKIYNFILQHPSFNAQSVDRRTIAAAFRGFNSSSVTQLKMLKYFPFLSHFKSASGLNVYFFRDEAQAQAQARIEKNAAARKNNDNDDKDDDNKDDDDDSDDSEKEYVTAHPHIELDVSNITKEDFLKYHHRTFGKSNPERRGKGDVVVQAMFESMQTSYALRKEFGEDHYDETRTELKGAVWSYDRFGVAVVPLQLSETEEKYLLIGGNVEDAYDPDFCIYNDIFVVDAKRQVYETFAYPREAFPPTDFHTATFVPSLGSVFIIGNVGYTEDRPSVDELLITPVYKLDLTTMKITKVETNSNENSPGWVSEHCAFFDEAENAIRMFGGKTGFFEDWTNPSTKEVVNRMNFKNLPDSCEYILHLEDFSWSKKEEGVK